MTQYLIKVFLSAVLIVAVAEISKRSSFLGGLLASLPLVSFLALIWLYLDTRDTTKVARLATSIFWLVLPSLAFFVALPPLLKLKMSFYACFGMATALMLACYGVMLVVLKKFGVNL